MKKKIKISKSINSLLIGKKRSEENLVYDQLKRCDLCFIGISEDRMEKKLVKWNLGNFSRKVAELLFEGTKDERIVNITMKFQPKMVCQTCLERYTHRKLLKDKRIKWL